MRRLTRRMWLGYGALVIPALLLAAIIGLLAALMPSSRRLVIQTNPNSTSSTQTSIPTVQPNLKASQAPSNKRNSQSSPLPTQHPKQLTAKYYITESTSYSPKLLLGVLTLVNIGYVVSSLRVINEGYEGIVERLGQYRRSLRPGLNYVIPLLDKVIVRTTRVNFVETNLQRFTTQDNISVTINAIMSWRIRDLQKAYYALEDFEESLKNLFVSAVSAEVRELNSSQIMSSRITIDESLFKRLNEEAESFGITILSSGIKEVIFSKVIQEALEEQLATESARKVSISNIEGIVDAIHRISAALPNEPDNKQILSLITSNRYLLGRSTVQALPEASSEDREEASFTVEQYIDSTILDGLKSLSTVYEENLKNKNYIKVVEVANSAYAMCETIIKSLDPVKDKDIYRKTVALSSYWKLNTDLYKGLI